LLHEDEQEICKARQDSLGQNSGVFKILKGSLNPDKSCELTLSETLPSGISRNNSLEVKASFCEKLKVGDKVKLSSHLIKERTACEGNIKKHFLILITSSNAKMNIDICTTYELVPSQ
jgi:hypothetical protein